MRSILRFLGLDDRPSQSPQTETETIRKITEQLDQLPPDRAKFIAAFSYILGRVANADLEISSEETAAMERIVAEQAGLPMEQSLIVVQMAKSQNRLFGATENYLVTKEFNAIAKRKDKLALLNCLFAVSSSDESISVREDNEIRQISRELLLEHRDFITARSAYRKHLAVLKKPDPED